MSQSQVIRGTFNFVRGSAAGGTQPVASTSPFTSDLAGNASSSLLFCCGLTAKTIEIVGATAQNPVVVEGTISEDALDKARWFALTGNIVANGLVTIQIGAGAPQPIFYEPDLTALRIRAVGGNLPGTFADGIGAAMAGVWYGDSWSARLKAARLGSPQGDATYKAI